MPSSILKRKHFSANLRGKASSGGAIAAVLAGGAALVACALAVRAKTRQAERAHPPIGQFIDVDGVRLHYVTRGEGMPLVILHGNGSMIEDLDISGLLDAAADRYRVIAFDRPGYGYSERPSGKMWTPQQQAQLLYRALRQLEIEQAVVVGHSWGTLVALALALDQPLFVHSLVLLSGYYYPTPRLDVAVNAVVATPLIGSLMRQTVSPLIGRLIWPLLLRRIFGPPATPARFSAFPTWLALRPSQLRASAAEGALMTPAAANFAARYQELQMPLVILTGDADRMVRPAQHARRLHRELPQSELRIIPGIGHMVYYEAIDEVMAAIDAAAGEIFPGASMARSDANARGARVWH